MNREESLRPVGAVASPDREPATGRLATQARPTVSRARSIQSAPAGRQVRKPGRAYWASGASGALLAAFLAGAAGAQTAPSTAAPAAGEGATTQSGTELTAASVGEIVVQAERRSEMLRNVPASLTVVTGASLAAIGPVRNDGDLLDTVPGLQFTNLGDPVNSEISLRGSGTERGTGADTSVGLYADGVYVGGGSAGRTINQIDTFDLDHIEVLEGPQGALYGRDAEYGIINLLPQQPTFSNSGYVDEVYNFSIKQNQEIGVVNYKLDDNWALRLGAEGLEQWGGFYYNPDRNTYYDTNQGYLLRGQLRYQNENFDADLLVQRQQMQAPSFASAGNLPPKNAATGFPGLPTYPDGLYQNPWSLAHNEQDYSKIDIDNVVLNINYDFHWASLHSTSSWRQTDTTLDYDTSYIDVPTEIGLQALGEKGAWPFGEAADYDSTTTWYEDLHLDGSPVVDGRVTWLAGLELMDQPDSGYTSATTSPCATRTAPNPVVGEGFCTGTPSDEICVPGLAGGNCSKESFVSPFGDVLPYSEKYFSWAPYASASVKLAWGFKIDGAVRYSHDHKTATANELELYTGQQYPFLTSGTVEPTNYLYDKGQWTYAATLSWKIPFSPWDDMLYTKVGTGYRVGGFNYNFTPPLLTGPLPAGVTKNTYYAPITPVYGDETDTSYEVGFKGDITHHAYVTIDAYYETTLNALAAVGDGCLATNQCETGNVNYTVNAGKVVGSGVEASLNTAWDVAGGHLALQLDGSGQTAKYVYEPKYSSSGEVEVGLPLVGTPAAENPRWLANVTFTYTHPVTDDVRMFFNALYHGSWGGIMDPETTAGVVYPLSNYNTVNLRTGIDYKQFEFAVIIDNLTNDVYNLHEFAAAGTNTVTGLAVLIPEQERLSSPQTVSVEATYRW